VADLKFEIFHRTIPQVKEVTPVADDRPPHAGPLPMAVASGSEEATVRACLENTGLLSLFDTIITPINVARGKPAPDMFLLAAERLGIAPADCLVFEDGLSGMEAARAAGMQAVFIPRTSALVSAWPLGPTLSLAGILALFFPVIDTPDILDQFMADAVPGVAMDMLWAQGFRHFGSYFFRYSLQWDAESASHQTIQPLRLHDTGLQTVQEPAPCASRAIKMCSGRSDPPK
jgi:hypothetical protein